MPSFKPMFRLISFVFIVSWGVTTNVASQMPAQRPAKNDKPMDTFPVFLSANRFRKNWFAPNLTPAFGALKMSTGVNPVYSEKKPFCWIVYLKPDAMPVKGGGGPP